MKDECADTEKGDTATRSRRAFVLDIPVSPRPRVTASPLHRVAPFILHPSAFNPFLLAH